MFDAKKMGEQIAHLRTGSNYTQEQLAEILQVSPQAVSKWENGKAVPVADYSGPEWPKSISFASLFTALKLFLGLEQRKDGKNRQVNDDEEYILQSAVTNVCFGYSYSPDEYIHDSLLIYGLDYEIHSQADYSEEEFIALACNQIEHGYPVIIIPKEYTDNILAVGFSGHGRILKGLGFLEGDDQKNAKINFDQISQYAGWYKADCDMMTLIAVKIRCRDTVWSFTGTGVTC